MRNNFSFNQKKPINQNAKNHHQIDGGFFINNNEKGLFTASLPK